MAEDKSKSRRRIRPSKVTVRERAEMATADQSKPKRRALVKLPGTAKKDRLPKPFSAIFNPIKWLLRHLVPGYFKSSYKELRQVTWPKLKQSRQLTTAVVLFAIVFGFFVTVLDFGLDKVFKKVFLK